jgi:hypothetical protein
MLGCSIQEVVIGQSCKVTMIVIGYNDSDLAGDLDSRKRKSTTWVLFFLGRSSIS